ncbi:MAG: Mu transposase C-terminal domain-containing protein [Spirochaetales bacterium]|jgi:putative transposase|nr:Mu transposase C-terminal domain-containing protein [Spirochaetales bacterium]
MDTTAITVKEIAKITGLVKTTILRRAEKEKWSYQNSLNKAKLFIISFLPEDIKIAIAAYQQKQRALVPCSYPSPHTPALPDPGSRSLPSGKRLDKGMAKADMLNLYVQTLEKAQHGRKIYARTEFMRAYNSGIAYPKIFSLVGKVNWKTVEGWKRTIKTTGETFNLCDQRGFCKRGERILTDQQKDVLLKCALHPNKPMISEAIRMAWSIMHTKGIPNGHSASTYRRWLQDWASVNYHIWTFSRKGAKAWNDDCAMYIERDYNLINVGDIVVADGHVLNFEILNPWTGKPKRMTLICWLDMKSSYPLGWEIMPTENTQAISAALRRAIIALGKYPQVAYLDNGKAFKSKFFNNVEFDEAGFEGLYRRLGMKTIFAWPYHGQSKTIERFFGTFAELERWCPTYSGTSIENKPPRMMRGEKEHRRLYNKVVGNNVLTMEQAHRAVAAWFVEYAQRPQRGHLAGRCPADLFLEEKGPGVDKTELTYLMMTRQTRAIRQNGINLQGTNYYNPALYGRKHMATIKYDLQDMSAIYVFDEHGKFICEAAPIEKTHPAANILGNDHDRQKLIDHITLKKHQEKEAGSMVRELLEMEVLPSLNHQMAQITNQGAEAGGQRQEVRGNVRRLPHLTDEGKKLEKEVAAILLKQSDDKAADKKEKEKRIAEGMKQYHESLGKTIRRQDINPDVVIEHEPILDDSPEIWNVLPDMPEPHRYEKLVEFEVRGWVIPKQWMAFMSYFEQTPEYLDRLDYYEEHRGRVADMFQAGLTQRREDAK